MADCPGGRYYSTVYIDDLCNNSCANPLFGSVNFNQTPGVQCPSIAQTVCGIFQIPANAQYGSLQLNVIQAGSVVGTVNAPSSLNIPNGTFCFTVPITAFGSAPNGNYEYQVVANFIRICPNVNFPLLPVFDNSANDLGPDVAFNPPILPAFNPVSAICSGSLLNPLPAISTNGIVGVWSPVFNNIVTSTYTFTPNSGQCASTTTLTITITPPVIPTFTPIPPLCAGSLSPLPTTSINGIVGTWSPLFNNYFTTTYTFIPNVGQCAQIATMTIIIKPVVAVNDNFNSSPIETLSGGITPSVLTNDTVNFNQATSSNVIVSIVNVTPSILPLPTISPSGAISIPPGTTIGTYTILYQIQEIGCTANITFGSATIYVGQQNTSTPPIAPGIRANNIVYLVDTQSNGKIIIGGYFTGYNNIYCYTIARLNTNLTYDTLNEFEVSGPIGGYYSPRDMKVIKTLGVNYDKILLVGEFTGFNGGSTGKGIIRLNADGTVDNTFNPFNPFNLVINKGISGNNQIVDNIFIFPTGHTLAGKILISGQFDYYNDYTARKLVLLDEDGSYNTDTPFNTNVNTIINNTPMQAQQGFNSLPKAIAVQSDGKIILGGYFTWYNGLNKLGIVRLNVNGTHDSTFNAAANNQLNPGILSTFLSLRKTHINKMVVQPDDKIIIAGEFTHYNNISRNNIARLNANGSLDETFIVGTGFNNNVINSSTDTRGLVRELILDTENPNDINVYVSGDFTAYRGVAVDEIIKIKCSTNPGTNDATGFSLRNGGPNGAANGPVWCMKRQNDGKIIIGGKFTSYGPFSALNVTRIVPASTSDEARISTNYYDSEPEIDLFAANNLIIYPNPTDGILYFKTENSVENNFSITISTVLGQKVFEKSAFSKDENSIDLTTLAKGTYFITLKNKEKTITKKLIKN